MTEREALQEIVRKVGTLTYGKERWFKQNGCWYDRMNCDYIQNETLVERVCTELDEEYADRKTENSSEKPNNSTISKMEQVDKDINVRSKESE